MRPGPRCRTGAPMVMFLAVLASAFSALNAHGNWGMWHDAFDGSTIFYSESFPGSHRRVPDRLNVGRVYYACRKGEGEWAFIYFGDGVTDVDGTWFRRDGPGQPQDYRTKWDKDTATLPFSWAAGHNPQVLMFYDDDDAIDRMLRHEWLTVELFAQTVPGSRERKVIVRYFIRRMSKEIPMLRRRCELAQ